MSLIHSFEAYREPTTSSHAGADLMSQIGVRMRFAKNEEIYGEGERADLIYRVLSGAVRTSRFMADGRRPVDAFYGAGDIFGFEAGERHAMSAEAMSNCEILVAKRQLMGAAGGQALSALIWEATVRDLDSTRRHLALLVRKTACERVASFLLDLAEGQGSDVVELSMSRQDMADYLGVTIETVSRMITQLQGAKVVAFKSFRQFRILDREALEDMAAS
jgi:CRP/FNR family transcriptional regulator, nitrogen fixation regulation protein